MFLLFYKWHFLKSLILYKTWDSDPIIANTVSPAQKGRLMFLTEKSMLSETSMIAYCTWIFMKLDLI